MGREGSADPAVGSEDSPSPPGRVAVTDAAVEVLRRLRAQHGELMFHQSGGCCDGSSPMCYPAGEFLTGDADVRLGELVVGVPDEGVPGEEGPVEGEAFVVPVWMSRNQYVYWRHTHLTIDVVSGRGAGFSLEAPEGVRFLIRSRLFSDEEQRALDDAAARDGADALTGWAF